MARTIVPAVARPTEAPHAVGHSAGLIVLDERACDYEDGAAVSFMVLLDGTVVDWLGWGSAGWLPDVSTWPNPPPDPTAVHTVFLLDDDGLALRGLRSIVDEHLRRYGECQTWVAPRTSRVVGRWARAGCPAVDDPGSYEPPTEEELAAANVTDVPDAERHFVTESRPTADELSVADLEAEAAKLVEERRGNAERNHEELGADELEALARRHIESRVAEARATPPPADG